MSERTNIQWCDSTWNPVIGCTKVSPGCLQCYAEHSLPAMLQGIGWGDTVERHVASESTWRLPFRLAAKPWVCDGCGRPRTEDVLCQFCHESAKHRRRVFACSLSDWIDPKWTANTLARFLDTIRRTPQQDYLLLTKRPELFYDRLGDVISDSWCIKGDSDFNQRWLDGHAPPNVWVGVSVEDQERTWERIGELVNIPAAKRWLSLEPLLGPVDLELRHGCRSCNHPGNLVVAWNKHGRCSRCDGTGHEPSGIDWAVIGGESGPKARPCNVEWIRSLRDQCRAAGVPVFVKQIGSKPTADGATWAKFPGATADGVTIKHPKGGDPAEWPEDLRVREWPK